MTATRTADATEVLDFLAGRQLVVLTGAGVSTDSGIPDYRGPGAPVRRPMTYQEFIAGPVAQQRYWARSHLGWARMGSATVGSSRVDLQACKLEYSIVSPK